MYFQIRFFLLFVLIFILPSCSKENSDKIRIGFSQCSSDSNWRKNMNHSMQVQASVYPNVQLSIYNGEGSAQKQIKDIERMIKEKMDIIIISPLEPNLIVNVLNKAKNLGIPVVLLDRKINSNNYTAYLGADNIEVGRKAGKYITSSSKQDINIIEVKGGDFSTPVLERSFGFHQIVDNDSRVNILRSFKGIDKGFPEKLFKDVLDSLNGKSIDFIYFFNDEMALDARKIVKDKGLENDIKFIGVDGLNGPDGGIQMVNDGVLEATLLYPNGGAEVIKLALQILNGEKVPKNSLLTTTVIDKFNADIMKEQLDRINQQQTEIESQVTAINKQEQRYTSQQTLLKVSIIFVVIILSLSIYSIYSVFSIRKKNRQLVLTNDKITIQRNQIQKIANKLKVSNEDRINFFAKLSHEFKTPLTLILSSIESIGDLVKEKGFKLGNEIELIYSNSNRLLELIDQLLDFRKNQESMFILRVSNTNLYTFSNNILNNFKREAKKRNINLNLKCDNENLSIYIDRNLMVKVYYNLLSNAFKFTPDNGKIDIVINDNKEKNIVSILFKDSGIGIPEKEIKNVFQVFFKGSNNRKNSSGIGLHLTKEFVELHKGNIDVKSLHGTEFKLILHKGSTHFSEEEIIIEHDDLGNANGVDFLSDHDYKDSYLVQNSNVDIDIEKYFILIIEDNKDLSMFLRNKLMSEYDICISDGSDAIGKAFEFIPDVIICDINLIDSNGFEICEKLKKDLRTSHIPIIILTAMSDKESYLQGLEAGADLYLNKPFSYSILTQSIKSLLYNRKNLRFYYTNNIHKIEKTSSSGNLEQLFLTNLNKLIEKNIDNNDFSVENLADNLNISRSQLYRKIKAMLGINISDYVTQFRLEKAKSMLATTSLTISEIAYKNGFSSPNYFSTAFKNKYGESPIFFRKSLSDDS
jgi:signal transduction histidine kinase/AraC-like DNA-binding protein/CRISPR/Cas system-associated endoribonuclease Cas2